MLGIKKDISYLSLQLALAFELAGTSLQTEMMQLWFGCG